MADLSLLIISLTVAAGSLLYCRGFGPLLSSSGGGLYSFIGSPSNWVTMTMGGERENWAGPGLGCKYVQVMTVTNAVPGSSERQN